MVEKVTLVWLNGPSQEDWLHLPRFHTEIGCNFFGEVRRMDHICCYDQRMKEHIQRQPHTRYWCKNGQRGDGWDEVTYTNIENPENSGMMAIKLAINLGHTCIRVLGCDWGVRDESVFESRYDNVNPGKKYDNNSLKLLKQWSRSVDIKFVSKHPIDVPVPLVSDPGRA